MAAAAAPSVAMRRFDGVLPGMVLIGVKPAEVETVERGPAGDVVIVIVLVNVMVSWLAVVTA